MRYRPFGKAGFNVSEVGMGCWAIGGNEFGNSYGPTDDALSVRAVKKAVELGCNFFDTADVYGHGHSEELLGLALRTVRERVFIATKVGGSYMYNDPKWGDVNFSPEYIDFALGKSLARLQTSYVDVYQLHNPPLYMIEEGSVFARLRLLQKKGKIRAVGVSVHTLDEGLAALDNVDSIQCVFNILDPRNYELMETAKRRGIAVIAREPLANGLAAGKYSAQSTFEHGDIREFMPPAYRQQVIEAVSSMADKFPGENFSQVAIRYVLSFDSVSVVIPGAKSPQQVDKNMRASELARLTDRQLAVFGS